MSLVRREREQFAPVVAASDGRLRCRLRGAAAVHDVADVGGASAGASLLPSGPAHQLLLLLRLVCCDYRSTAVFPPRPGETRAEGPPLHC